MKYPSRRRKNLLFLVFSIIVAFVFSQQPFFRDVILSLGGFGYLGAFLGGLLFSSSFTIFFSLAVLTAISQELSPVIVSLVAGFGAVLGDIVFLRFFKDEIVKDLEPIYEQLGGNHLHKILHTKYFSWTLPVLGAAIIASPLPDEIGVSLLGLGKLSPRKFLAVSYFLNTLGILAVIAVEKFL